MKIFESCRLRRKVETLAGKLNTLCIGTGLFSSLSKDPIILVDTPPPPKADGGTQDSDSGKCGLLSPFAAIQNIGVSYFATKLPITSTVTGPGSRSWRGVTGGEQPPAHQELNTLCIGRDGLTFLGERYSFGG